MHGTGAGWRSALCALIVLVGSGLPVRGDTLEQLQASLRSTEQAFAASAQQRDLDAFRTFLAGDVVFAGGAQVLRGPEAVVQAWSPFFAAAGPEIHWEPESAEVLAGGELGMTRGPYRLTSRSKDGTEIVAEGTFFSVWRREGEGWKIVLDGGTKARPVAMAPKGGPFAKLGWLVGSWRGTGLGGECQDVWSEAAGGAMLGMFRLLKEGEPVFYELMTITEEDGALSLRLKHFGPDLVGWEEREESVTFPPLSVDSESLVFDGLAYYREGEDGLRIEVRIDNQDGSTRTEVLELRRIG